ncbi:MAG: VOC family protein [Acidobacteria bacterium]|nr:MAG: VOC family protein [Acidobacteriota bacterium]
MPEQDRIVPEIFVHDGVGALEFYKRAFGAVEQSRMMGPDGRKLLHGALEILGHKLVVCDEFSAAEGGTCRCPRTLGGTDARFILQVDDADAAVTRAVAAGARVLFPLQKMFWGGRYAKLVDPYGHEWGINEQVEQPTDAEEAEQARRYFSTRNKEVT